MESLANSDVEQMKHFLCLMKETLPPSHPPLIMSVGSTPTVFSLSSDHGLPSVLEMHPGNYTFFDRQQLWTGACTDKKSVACRVLARVIGHYEDRNTIMLDAGATALTKDLTPQGGYAEVDGYPQLECYRLSQEVMLLRPKDATQRCPFEVMDIGSPVFLIPNHSCLAAACFDRYYIVDDDSKEFSLDQEVVEEWVPVKGWQ